MKNIIFTSILLLSAIYSCNNNYNKTSITREIMQFQTDSLMLDSIKKSVFQLRKFIIDNSGAPREVLDKNFKLLDYYLYSFVSLEEIHKDSIRLHAPLVSVNKMVDEYNIFIKKNIHKNYELMKKFSCEDEYYTTKFEYLSLVLRNEIQLDKNYGYYRNDQGKFVHVE